MLAVALVGPAASAGAAPDDVDPVPGSTTLSLVDMGASTPLAFYGEQGTAELTFPVPRGLTPVALNAIVELPVNVRAGMITATQDGRTIARVALPADDEAPITVPLAGVSIVDNAATVTLRAYSVPNPGTCLDPTNPLRLINGAVDFAGEAAPPRTVADFLPTVLKKLTIAIPSDPTRAESDAAVRLAAAIVARYGRQPTAVAVVRLGTPSPPTAPFERRITIQQGPDTGLALQGPDLRISGPEPDLINQARLLSSDISELAISSKAVVGPLKTSPQLPGNVTTLSALGQPTVSAVALSPQVAVGLDQTRIGRPARGIRVHLVGSYTPLPQSMSGRLTAIVGPETIDTWSVDDRGVIDRWIDVPDTLLQRYTTLGITLNMAGNTGRCGEFQPLTLTVNGDSVVESLPAVPPVPGGLQSIPQALMPRTLIGIGPDAYADTVRAVGVAVALQRLSALPIDTAVTSADEALRANGPAVIVAADGWDHPETPLPVDAEGGTITLNGVLPDGKPTTLTLDPQLGYGSLQAFFDGRRSLLVATSNAAPGQLDALLRWVDADPRRFSKLDGVAVVAAPREEPVVVRPQPGVAASAESSGRASKALLALGALSTAVVAVAAVIALRGRRARPDG